MKLLNVKQGTQEWHDERNAPGVITASEASAVMGDSLYMSRDELLQQKATGVKEEPSEQMQKIFDAGHRLEAIARPIAEEIIGEELYPVVGKSDCDNYLASFDGLTMCQTIVWEHKTLNEKLRSQIPNEDIDMHYVWQLEHQLMVSGAEKALFHATSFDGESEYMWYISDPELRKQLIAGIEQFEKDLNAYEYTPPAEVITGNKPAASLPPLNIQATGMVKVSNFNEYKDAAMSIFNSVNRNLETDQDYADAEETVKWCKKVESGLSSAEESLLAQASSIYSLLNGMREVSETARKLRLELDKLVKEAKKQKKMNIAIEAKKEIESFVQGLNDSCGGFLAMPSFDFNSAMKGKKTIDSLQSAANDEVARVKIEATQSFQLIEKNLKLLEENKKHNFLFSADFSQIVNLPSDHLKAEIKSRIADYDKAQDVIKQEEEAAEKARLEKEAMEKQKQQETTETEPKLDVVDAKEPAPGTAQNQTKEEAPSASEIIGIVAEYYQVTNKTAQQWLAETNFL